MSADLSEFVFFFIIQHRLLKANENVEKKKKKLDSWNGLLILFLTFPLFPLAFFVLHNKTQSVIPFFWLEALCVGAHYI